jgi:hypothetical protein
MFRKILKTSPAPVKQKQEWFHWAGKGAKIIPPPEYRPIIYQVAST